MISIVYICQSPSPNSSPPHRLGMHVCFLPLYLYFCFVNKIVYTNFFRFHTYALICNICFPLSDLLHCVWQSLGQSMSLKMTQFCSFLWLIFYCIYVPHLLYPFICRWAFRCFHDLAIVNSAAMNIGVHVSFWIMFFSGYMPSSGMSW